jgi:predicted amidohydrolase
LDRPVGPYSGSADSGHALRATRSRGAYWEGIRCRRLGRTSRFTPLQLRFISPGGELLLHHRKINELDIAHDLYSIGDRLGVVETELATFGLNVCADNFPDSLDIARTLARMGAQVILSPSAWAVDADHDNEREPYGKLWFDSYSELARQFDVTVVGVSNVGWITAGAWKGRKCIGCSLAVGPDGILARGPYGDAAETVTVVEIAPRPPIGRGTQISEALRTRG